MSKPTTDNRQPTTRLKFLLVLLLVVGGWWLVGDTATHAQQLTEYTLLQPLPLTNPGTGVDTTTNASTYLPGLFRLTIAIAGVLAVLRLIYAGIIYMSSDAYGNKSEAKGIIEDALWGLALTFGAWIIVATIMGNGANGSINFNLNLPTQPVTKNQNPPGGGTPGGTGGGGSGAGCQTNCPYSHTVNGVIIKYRDCVSCSVSASFLLNLKTASINGQTTMLNTALGNKLKDLNAPAAGTPSFRVTETWPPTVNHFNPKQWDGTAVDISLIAPSAANINKFIQNAEARGLKVLYEVTTQAQKDAYVRGGVPANKIAVYPQVTGEHFSVE